MLRVTGASRPVIRRAGSGNLPVVLQIVAAAGLPTDDLPTAHGRPSHELRFWLASDGDEPLGVIGLERFGAEGLLRSLAVVPGHRRRGLGRELVTRLERDARAEGVDRIVLLTETAETFFRHLGFEVTNRAAVSGPVRQSAEFRSLCPASAICMGKVLRERPADVREEL